MLTKITAKGKQSIFCLGVAWRDTVSQHKSFLKKQMVIYKGKILIFYQDKKHSEYQFMKSVS